MFATAHKRAQRGVQYTYLQKRAAASRHRDLCRLDLARGSQASQAGEDQDQHDNGDEDDHW